MNATISIDRLRIHARHGVMPQERTVGNEFEVSLKIGYPVDSSALDDDDLRGTLNYARVIDLVKSEMSIPSQLLEHVAARILRTLRRTFPDISSIEVTVTKLTPPVAGTSLRGVSVTLTA